MTNPLVRKIVDLPSLAPVLQERVFEAAVDDSDYPTLQKLVERDDLCQRVDDMFADVAAARVLRVWLDRPDRNMQLIEQLARTERRKTVLAVLAAKEDLSHDAYQAIVDRGVHQADEALVVNATVPAVIRHQAIDQLVRTYAGLVSAYSNNSKQSSVLGALSSIDEADADALASATARHAHTDYHRASFATLSTHATAHPLSRAAAAALLQWFEESEVPRNVGLTADTSVYRNHLPTVAEALVRLVLNSDLSSEQIAQARALTATCVDNTRGYSSGADPLKQIDEAVQVNDMREQLLAQADSEDPAIIDKALAYAARTRLRSLGLALCERVLVNPACTPEQFATAAERLPYTMDRTARALGIAADQGDTAKQTAILTGNHSMRTGDLDLLTDPLTVVRDALLSGDVPSYRERPLVTWMLDNGHGHLLPARMLVSDMVSVDRARVTELYDAITVRIAPDREAWGTMLSLLASTFDGTVEELIETVVLLNPDATVAAAEVAPAEDATPDDGADPAPAAATSHDTAQLSLL